jgi:hypothetical protein
LLQETPDDGDSQLLPISHEFKHDFVPFRSPLNASTGGLLTLIPKDVAGSYHRHTFDEIIPGRLTCVTFHTEESGIVIVNVHIEGDEFRDTDGKIRFLKALGHFLAQRQELTMFVGGDFNLVTDRSDRVSLRDGTLCGNPGCVYDAWLDLFPFLAEHVQDSLTRFPRINSAMDSAARLDRIYSNAAVEVEAIMNIRSATIGQLPDSFVSDHLAVVSRMVYKNDNAFSNELPDCIVD